MKLKTNFFRVYCCLVKNKVRFKNMTRYFVISSILYPFQGRHVSHIECPVFKVVALWRYFVSFLEFGLSCYIKF